ncbi:hypothetical protein OVA14_07135 [Agrococcus sp. SL85]|uniref:hypothetical protein n=1 Tax=Agrococcus sp. SL85 TaxID=2995141 RepID=UPI00226C8E0E|nr:hypothetical protein [Agrococcus sp. SL85]WAC65166.1 hypothetical protein OVA14_07135 [Agrococcus sp. SL85]
MKRHPKPTYCPPPAAVLAAHQEPTPTLAHDEQHDMHLVLNEIADERERQNAKWGQQNHPDRRFGDRPLLAIANCLRSGDPATVSSAALAGAAKRATNEEARRGSITWQDILLEEVFEAFAELDDEALRTELVQVAAVATQWVEAIDRRNHNTEEPSR